MAFAPVLDPESGVVPGAFVKADDPATSAAPDRCRLYIVGVFVILQVFFPLILLLSPLARAPDDEVITIAVIDTPAPRSKLWRARCVL